MMKHKVVFARKGCIHLGAQVLLQVLLSIVLILPAQALRFDTGNPDFQVRWDNTLKYSTAFRVAERSDTLTETSANPSNVNLDDGDRNFDPGLISNRLDLLSEFDAVYKNFGVRLSGAAWYDFVYNESNDNGSPLTANAYSKPHNAFTDETRDLHGRDAELLDAFVFGYVDAGVTTTSFRLGQYAMQWGESLFFGNNGIGVGMAPLDIVKLLSVPNSQFKEIIRPIPQASAQLQIGPRVTLGAYYQFKWERNRLPGAGSYFSIVDAIDEGGERMLLGVPPPGGTEPVAWFRGEDIEADDAGQWGAQVRVRPGMELDLGFYAIHYHDKGFQFYGRPGALDVATGKAGEYFLAFPEDIEMYGISASRSFGSWNLATEVSLRDNTPLVSALQIAGPGTDNSDNPAYAVGRSVHANFSWLASFGPSLIANEASFLGEVAWNQRTAITDNEAALDPNTTQDAWGFRMTYEPTYRQVWSGLDLSVPVGFSYFPRGKSSVVGAFGPNEGGDMNIGLKASYLDVWRFSLTYTHYYGSQEAFLDQALHQTMKQSLADRDYIAFSIYRTF